MGQHLIMMLSSFFWRFVSVASDIQLSDSPYLMHISFFANNIVHSVSFEDLLVWNAKNSGL